MSTPLRRLFRALPYFVFLTIVIAGVWRLYVVGILPPLPFHKWAEVGDASKAVALLSAAAYFLWKTASGNEIANLSLDVSASRLAATSEDDWLNVEVRVKKGARGTLRVHDAAVRLTPFGATGKDHPLLGFNRLQIIDGKRKLLTWRDSDREFLNLAAEDETIFSFCGKIPNSGPCDVEVAISGIRGIWFFPPSQWRASIISLPEKNTKK